MSVSPGGQASVESAGVTARPSAWSTWAAIVAGMGAFQISPAATDGIDRRIAVGVSAIGVVAMTARSRRSQSAAAAPPVPATVVAPDWTR